MKKVITTVGISMFTNYLKQKKDIKIHYRPLVDLAHGAWDKSQARIERIREAVGKWVRSSQGLSAELKSLQTLRREWGDDFEVYLLATDTVLSRLAAEIIAENLIGLTVRFDPQIDVIKGLQVNDGHTFEKEGLPNLIERLYDLWDGYSDNVILNITGGYKGVIPYMTIMGQINDIPICYIFENTDELLWIPQAPLDISYGVFEKYSPIFKDLEEGVMDWGEYKLRHNLGAEFQSCIWQEEDMALLNPVGKMFWEKYQRYFIVLIPSGSRYFFEKATKKREIDKAIKTLYHKLAVSLDNFTIPLSTIKTGDNLRHAVIVDNTNIYKHTNPQIRIQYTLEEDRTLKVINYHYRSEGKNYSRNFAEQYERLKNRPFRAVPFTRRY